MADSSKEKPSRRKEKKAEKKVAENAQDKDKGSDKSKQLGMGADKASDFSEWYSQILTKAELIEYYDVSGCYILRPWSYQIWEEIRNFFDADIKKLGVQNSYFPLFVSERALCAEESHIEGFAPEVAWVTKAGKSPLKAPIAVRPTRYFSLWQKNHTEIREAKLSCIHLTPSGFGRIDLPLKLNQWSNVVRWEFKHPTPFIRSREFLWQEGHTAFATEAEAAKEVRQILDLYAKVYQELLAVPVIQGQKTEKEKFAGGYYTTTIECFIPSAGRGIQAATSHCLGQNFAKIFDIQFENENGVKELVWQNSWGLTTRSIGIMIMTHGDNKGLLLPPRVAPLQAVLVPIFYKDKDNAELLRKAKELIDLLTSKGIRAHLDERTTHNPGFKYNHWEMKGVPIRLDFGPKDMDNNTIVIVRRDTSSKETVSNDNLVQRVREVLEDIQATMFANAKKTLEERKVKVLNWEDFVPALDQKKLVLSPWCKQTSCEDKVKEDSGAKKDKKEEKKEEKKPDEEEFEPISGAAKSLCMPFDQPPLEPGTKCFHCGQPAQTWCLWGRSY